MSNIDYHIGFRAPPKRRTRRHKVKLWLKRIVFAAVIVSLGIFLFETFISKPTPHNKANISQSLDSTPNKDIRASSRNIQKEITGDINQITLKETTLEEENGKKYRQEKSPETLNNNVLMASVEDETPIFNSYSSKNSEAKVTITTPIKIETVTIETKPEMTLTSSQIIMELTQPSKPKAQNIEDINDIQSIYQKDLDRLSNEAEFDKLFNYNHSEDLKLIEL